jgi:hypothetical protein
MSSFDRRPEEMLRELEVLRPVLPAQAIQNFESAIAKYKAWRGAALDELLKLLEEDGGTKSALGWSDKCSTMRAAAPQHFESALNSIELGTEAAATGYRWQLTLMTNEGKFFEELGKANAAQVRDYLVKNKASLEEYTKTLDGKWRAIVDNGNKLQAEEQSIYSEMLESTRRIVADFAAAERTAAEQMVYAGTFPVMIAEKLGGPIAGFFNPPEGMGKAIELAAGHLRGKMMFWLDANRALWGRLANYKALVQAEKGGVLPLFKETRREVHAYWECNKIDLARDWMSRFRSSLEGEWISRCPTAGQQEDAKAFYNAAFERVDEHLKSVETVARLFEDTWSGVFKGALAPKTIDELVDSQSWRANADELIAIRTPEVVGDLLNKLEGYYEESLERPLNSLLDRVGDLPEPAREEARRAIEQAKKRVEESLKTRIHDMQRQIGESLRWFEPAQIQQALDRGELEGELD